MAANEIPDETRQEPATLLPMDRAEVLFDSIGQRLGEVASRTSKGLLKAAARAREEAEDMWAEARTIHENNRSGNGGNERH